MKRLNEIIDTEKVANFIINSQLTEGCFSVPSPMIYTTYLCVSVLNDCGYEISENTKRFIESLQEGSWGFAELPGEMPWTDRTFYGLQMMKIIGKEPKYKEKMIKFYQSLQNKDGGFGSIGNSRSNLIDTFQVIQILDLLDSKPIDVEGAIKYMESNNIFSDIKTFFNYVKCYKILRGNVNFNKSVIDFLNFMENSIKKNNFEEVFYFLELRSILIENIDLPDWLDDQIKIIEENIQQYELNDVYFIVKIFKKIGKLKKISEKVLEMVKILEIPQGGFYHSNEKYIFKNNKGFHTLYLLGKINNVGVKRYLNWLLQSSTNYSWGHLPGFETHMEHYTRSSLEVFKFSNFKLKKTWKKLLFLRLKNKLKEYLTKETSCIDLLRTFKETLECFYIMKEKIEQEELLNWLISEQILYRVLKFFNDDGGFGDPKRSFMYTTFLAVRIVYLLERFFGLEKTRRENFIKEIKEKCAKWILSCQNADGGFGYAPDENSNIQATFYALYSLWMLNKEIDKKKELVEWLKNFQNSDGGFSVNCFASDFIITFYVIGCFIFCYGGI
ncbi:MAG: prenyltransferase/squalene oxidase repeat-containing protein [Candidatus Aenigmatarchaeota archaeon]